MVWRRRMGGNMQEPSEKEARDKTCMDIGRFFFENGIAFNVAKSPSFINMCRSIGNFKRGLKPPTPYELGTTILNTEEENTKAIVANVDVSNVVKDATLLFNLLDEVVEEIGEDIVVQVVTDNASNYKKAGEMLMKKRTRLWWTPCAAHSAHWPSLNSDEASIFDDNDNNFAESEHQSLPDSTIVQDQDFRKSSTISQMKYVRPYTLVKEFQKKTKELAQRQSLGGASLLGLTVMGDYVSIGYSMPKFGIDSEYTGIVSTKERDIDDIAIEFRDLNFKYNVAGYAIGLPLTKEKDNPEVAKVKNFVADLYSTQKLKGLKYTYFYERSASKYLAEVWQKPQSPSPPFVERWVGKCLMQEYYNLYLKELYPIDEDDDEDD
ncbi:hypothetical protein Q3G72_002040 [Acer saccharum]|nr:hypothetical protein Q3G72_002040 [Acer saccharum]